MESHERALLVALNTVAECAQEFFQTVPPLTAQRSARIQKRLDQWAMRRAGLAEALARLYRARDEYQRITAHQERLRQQIAEADVARRAARARRPWWKFWA